MTEILFWGAGLLLIYVFGGYLQVLRLAACIGSGRADEIERDETAGDWPNVTVLITAHNEEAVIEEKIRNVLSCSYPRSRLEVLVASDGSTDRTDELVWRFEEPEVRLFRVPVRSGKTGAQNQATEVIRGDIIIFTDADTRFEPGLLEALVGPFVNPAVGGADGRVLLSRVPGSYVSENQGRYWSYELRLRETESRLGILAVAAGACMAVRRDLFRPIDPAYGEDCIVPLDVVLQGRRMVHVPEAIARDRMPHELGAEFTSRVRMTVRNWRGTWSRLALLNPFRHPGYAFALWSHKVLRWLSPFFLVTMTVCAAILAFDSLVYQIAVAGLLAFYLAGALGWLAEAHDWRLPVVRSVFSFLLANAGFLVGVLLALSGRRITAYRTA